LIRDAIAGTYSSFARRLTAPRSSQLRYPSDRETMNWEKAETAEIDPKSFYLVKDNGGEWRDFDLSILKGPIVKYRMRPEIVRGRPVWISKITDPTLTSG
jgi:hypothetical protein